MHSTSTKAKFDVYAVLARIEPKPSSPAARRSMALAALLHEAMAPWMGVQFNFAGYEQKRRLSLLHSGSTG